ncbi:tRNA pseudouridine(55) synthase TruB [bacterium]|nr:tRNA pseudouridine(55) synthase TruB [bacterium]
MSSKPPVKSGLLNVLKPPGMTAHDVVAALRRRLGTKKVGHAGTLDPVATGVLPVAVGTATRLLPYLQSGKEYLAEIQFGVSTSTGDCEGEILDAQDCVFDRAALEAVMPRFRGAIQQRPPMVSAVHYQGKRLYELAREGIVIEDLPLRDVTIEALELVEFYPGARPKALVRVACSAGTYIRSLAIDLGAALGCPASLAFLLRTRAGDFVLDDAFALDEDIRYASEDAYLAHLTRRDASPEDVEAIGYGRTLSAQDEPDGALVRVHAPERLLAIYERRGALLHPRTVFPA